MTYTPIDTPHGITLWSGGDLERYGILEKNARLVEQWLAIGDGGTRPVPASTLLELARHSLYAMITPTEPAEHPSQADKEKAAHYRLAGHVAVYSKTPNAPEDPPALLLRSLIVPKVYRGCGIAGTLIAGAVQFAEALAESQPHHLLARTTSPELFEKFGFEIADPAINTLYPITDNDPAKVILYRRIASVIPAPA